MRTRKRKHDNNNQAKAIFFSIITVGVLQADIAKAELSLAFFAGKSFTDDGDLTLKQGNTHLDFKNVSWDDHSFDTPIYYGMRVGYWFDSHPNWGFSVDFNHMKNYLDYAATVPVSGVRGGVAVNGREPISNTIEDFNMSHGLNTLTFNAQYRWFPAGVRDDSLLGRIQLYAGLGAGFSIPHVEAKVNGIETYEYQWGAGPVINGLLGFNVDIYRFVSGFVEYKLTYADVEAELKGGGSINTETVNHQIIFGLAGHFDL
jgi:lipid A oxidase